MDYTYSNDGNISYNHGSTDTWLVKISSSGNLLWEKCYGGSESDVAMRIFQAGESNDLFLVGGSNSTDGDISNNPYPGSVSHWILKIDINQLESGLFFIRIRNDKTLYIKKN